jgi:hypothetical protein
MAMLGWVMEAFKQEVPGTTTELAKRFAVSAVPLNSREQLRMQGIVSSSPPYCRWLASHLAEPTSQVHKAIRQRIRLSPPHSSEPLAAILAFVPRQDGDEVDTDWFAVRPVRLCFWIWAWRIIVKPIERQRVRIVLS